MLYIPEAREISLMLGLGSVCLSINTLMRENDTELKSAS